MNSEEIIRKKFNMLDADLAEEIIKHGIVKEYEEGIDVIKEGQYIRSIPILLEGLMKVFCRYDEKELLLYYLESEDSCVMSFTASLNNGKSKIYATTEKPSKLLLLPVEKFNEWIKKYPRLAEMFFTQYNERYGELLDTIKGLLIDKMDTRLYNYLLAKGEKLGECMLPLKHKEIALELGTAREVISRMMKKLEIEGKVKQHSKGIELLNCTFSSNELN